MSLDPIAQRARAKINLTLHVAGKRPDGYHELESLVVFADAGDGLTVAAGAPFELTVEGRFAGAIDGENLIERAWRIVAGLAPQIAVGRVVLDKRLPVASGIGGGSADAAAFLRALQSIDPAHTRQIPWDRIARELGADVPVCLVSQPMLMTGLGETLGWVRDMPRMPAVLVTPDVEVPAAKTREIFRRLAAKPLSGKPTRVHPQPLPTAPDEIARLVGEIGNDLARPAIELWPVLGRVARLLSSQSGCRAAGLSGAGPTTFALFDSIEAARRAAADIAEREPGWWVTPTIVG